MNATASNLAGGAISSIAVIHWTHFLLWSGSLAFGAALVILLWSRWGRWKPLSKCAVLSLIAHLLLAFLTMTVRIITADDGGGGGGSPIRVRLVEDVGPPAGRMVVNSEPKDEVTAPPLLPTPPLPADTQAIVEYDEPAKRPASERPTSAASVDTPAAEITAVATSEPSIPDTGSGAAEQPAQNRATAPPPPNPPPVATTDPAEQPLTPVAPAANNVEVGTAGVASVYALRNASGRPGLVAGQGGNAETEAAVAAALRWLASAQSRDGRWNAIEFGAGQEELVLGQNRGGAGRGADTGISALAILAFLGAGHSHMQGAYQENVHRGLDFLLRAQAGDGSLFGDASLYAQMYCHAMATFALAEAHAVTGDHRLGTAVTKAVNYSLAAQNTSTGGWRYRPGDTGDTSQLGWQLMALASAERAGMSVPGQTWNRVDRFLQSVRRGPNGGLASYRPDSPASTSMTAEALYCRMILQEMSGTIVPMAAGDEATTQLLAAPPAPDRLNLYYWYYATLALHHRQMANETAATAWRTWNDAMVETLTKTQVAGGDNAGSWDTNTIWGGYGGRVYTTAMAAMCLEVYYRYAPAPAQRQTSTASRLQPPAIVR